MNPEPLVSAGLSRVLHDYVMRSGGVLAAEVDQDGSIVRVSDGFRRHFRDAESEVVEGVSIWRFLKPRAQSRDVLCALPESVPVPQLFHVLGSDDQWLMHLYSLGDNILFIGESAAHCDSSVIERMSQLSTQMMGLVRDMRQSYRRLSQTNDRNEQLARLDPLTRLANRRYFLERLENAFEHARSRNRQLSVLSIDLDHFKSINDSEGHAGGDAALVMVADSIRAVLRLGDVAGRFGGEEFLVYLPDSNLACARAVAERLLHAIRECGHLSSGKTITASIGVAARGDQTTVEALLKDADDRMYQAKSEGRNRVAS